MTLGGLPLTPDGHVRSVWSAERLYLLIISLLEVEPKILGHFWGLDLPGSGKNRQKNVKSLVPRPLKRANFGNFGQKCIFWIPNGAGIPQWDSTMGFHNGQGYFCF